MSDDGQVRVSLFDAVLLVLVWGLFMLAFCLFGGCGPARRLPAPERASSNNAVVFPIRGLLVRCPSGVTLDGDAVRRLQRAVALHVESVQIPWMVPRGASSIPSDLPPGTLRITDAPEGPGSPYEPGRPCGWNAGGDLVVRRGPNWSLRGLTHALAHVYLIRNDYGHRDPRWPILDLADRLDADYLEALP